ncbi:ABC transporter substrate-binding protein [Hydrogenobaculum acidophilum]
MKLSKVSLILVPFFITACSQKSNVSSSGNQYNRENKTPKYAVLFPMALPFCFMLKAQNRIVGYPGMNRKAVPFFAGNLILKEDPDFIDKTIDIGNPHITNLEVIKSLNPSLVITAPFGIYNEKLNNMGIKTFPFCGQFCGVKSLLSDVNELGKLLNHQKDAKEIEDFYKQDIDYAKLHLQNIKRKPKVLYLTQEGPSGKSLTAGGGFTKLDSELISMAGGVDVAKDVKGMFGQISTEDMIKWNPDFIFIGAGGNVNSIYKNKALSHVSAVVNKRVYVVPSFCSSEKSVYSNWYSSEQFPLGLIWTAYILHPTHFQHFKSYIQKEEAKYLHTFWNINSMKVCNLTFK